MSVEAVVSCVDDVSCRSCARPSWGVTVTLPPCQWARRGELYVEVHKHAADPAPCAVGDKVTVPVHGSTTMVVHHPGHDAKIHTCTYPRDPNEPLNPVGHWNDRTQVME